MNDEHLAEAADAIEIIQRARPSVRAAVARLLALFTDPHAAAIAAVAPHLREVPPWEM